MRSRVARLQPLPQTRADLHQWVRQRLHLSAADESALLEGVDLVLARQEALWRESKQEALHAVAAGYADRVARLTRELREKDTTAANLSSYFEHLVTDLTDRSHRDPKTKLMNFTRFTEQLEAFLVLERRGRWCAVGLADITSFKQHNDTLGHAVGDRIIVRVAHILREQVRPADLLAQERPAAGHPMHARFGGDEFCFFIPDLADPKAALDIGERFRRAVARFEWSREDPGLAARGVTVDVGVVCLELGPVEARRLRAQALADELIRRADELMYEGKGHRAQQVHFSCVTLVDGVVTPVDAR